MTTTIDHIESIIIDVPTVRGHVLSMTTMMTQSVVLVHIRFSDGSEGWGEGASIGGLSYGPESVESIKLAIDTYIAPILLGKNGDRIADASELMSRAIKGNHAARSAVETALWDGLARRLGVSVAQLFGGRIHDRLPVAWTLASGNSETDIAEAERMIAERRHRDFKLKIGKRKVKDDLAHVAAIARAVGDRGTLRVDVNQAWNLTEARYGVRGLQEIGCVLVEQPVPRDQLSNLRALSYAYEIAIMADEVLQGPADAMRVAADRSADVFAVKVCQSGGLAPAAQVIAIARAAGIELYAGTMLETGLGTAAATQLFATVPELQWGTELFGPLLLTEEILLDPLDYADFSVAVPKGPGIGAEPDPDKLNFYRRDRPGMLKAVSAT
ncbi:muconate/chloromuconate family cycloisomerase [Nitratireductor indicus]|uniref:Muconate cycloisomerase n=1 Tax=Nitratireductor indicus C115 TaxID=1231190 RepID=K2PQ44_9HYPH|nr:muconate/chloromuconate family cycloisomerase [Nitratireductor indicus]EKF43167.1 muconate cycloisomerase [Nitratireductor indicus C115]MDS1137721.1 muconate/chloromuconate family cycloisomerase [Nitratireductor indicus]SFQ53319.1 muconate cycloisomerase [Nitratireductor indicus]